MLKKILILTALVAISVSPLFPRVFADFGDWTTTVAEAAWDYDYYSVERLALDGVSGPYDYNNAVFVASTAKSCEFPDLCDMLDLTILKNGETLEITDVGDTVTSDFQHTAQDGRFIYRVPSESDSSWGTVYEYDPETGSTLELTDLARDTDGIAFMTFATDGNRVYFSTLHEDETTGDIESELSVYDYDSGFGRDDFTYLLTAPWQEILDVHDGIALVKFQFEGGYKQLWLVDQTQRTMVAIPDTWVDTGSDIVGGHFLSDGSVQFFMNYRLYRFNPETDIGPIDAGGAYLSWYVDTQDAVQIVGDRMAYIDDENGLYVSGLDGVNKFGVALNGSFNLDDDAIYFRNLDGDYVGYHFSTGEWETTDFLVTDTYDDIRVGIDVGDNVWYENLTTGYLLNIGYGQESAVLSDHEHAYWRGADGNIYEATFSPLLDLERENVEAFSSYDAAGVYLIKDDSIWLVPDETVYFSWFDSWDDTVEVSPATMELYLRSYDNKGSVKFAPGTRVKSYDSPRVYVVGNDYELHWITSETVADEIYGSNWNLGIIEVNDTYLWKYATGDSLYSADEIRSI